MEKIKAEISDGEIRLYGWYEEGQQYVLFGIGKRLSENSPTRPVDKHDVEVIVRTMVENMNIPLDMSNITIEVEETIGTGQSERERLAAQYMLH